MMSDAGYSARITQASSMVITRLHAKTLITSCTKRIEATSAV